MPPNPPQPSQRITPATHLPRELQALLDRRELDAFWRQVESRGTPIISPIPNSSNVQITYLARGSEGTTSITGNGGGFYWKEIPFTRVADTDVWFATVEVPPAFVGSYVLLRNLPPNIDYWEQRKFLHLDAFNRNNRLDWRPWPAATGTAYSTHVVETPGALPLQYLDQSKSYPRGERHSAIFQSSILGNERDLFIYRPPGFVAGKALPTLIVFDGSAYFHAMKLPEILDAMIAAQVIPPLAAICLCSIDTPTRNRELPCNPDFIRMLSDELLPFVTESYGISTKNQPIALAGSSYGGLAALYGAVTRPDLFTHVLSQAGAFYWAPDDFQNGHTVLPAQIEQSRVLPQKLYMDAGSCDNIFTSEGKHPHILAANQSFKQQLERMGYQNFHYQEYIGGHDYGCWQRTLPIGLKWLFGATAS